MAPAQFLSRLKRNQIAPAYLFLGSEDYERLRLREALIDASLGPSERENGLARYDLNEADMATLIDDARSLSLFASARVILAINAEAALPRGRAGEESDEVEPTARGASAGILSEYLRDPSPGVVLLFEASRFDFEGEDKKKLERVRQFYAAIPDVVELRRFSPEDARAEAAGLARRLGVAIGDDALESLVEALGSDVTRIAVELEKLSLWTGRGRAVTADEIGALVPDARTTTIFALVNALGRRDRARSLLLLDTLSREGEYLPLALAFLATQFRMALVAKEAGLRSAGQIQSHFSRLGVPMWGSRAEQVAQTVARFSKAQLERGLQLTFEADKGLRGARPDDRIVMEKFVLGVTG